MFDYFIRLLAALAPYAWPIFAAFFTLYFGPQIRGLLPRIKRFKKGDVEFELDKLEQGAERSLEAAPASPVFGEPAESLASLEEPVSTPALPSKGEATSAQARSTS